MTEPSTSTTGRMYWRNSSMPVPKQKPGKSKQDYQTPQEFLAATCDMLNIEGFDWDLAASPENTVAPNFFTEADNSLAQDWTKCQGWCWLNPPFSHIAPWAQKANEARGTNIAMLIPASVGSNWWAQYVHE